MTNVDENLLLSNRERHGRWHELAARVLEGRRLTDHEGLAILRSGDEELLEVLAAAYRVRYRWFGNRVHLNLLINAKSGACGEDCGYCSQSKVSKAEIPRYNLLGPEQILDGARMAARRRAGTYCIVVSGRAPNRQDLDALVEIAPLRLGRIAHRGAGGPAEGLRRGSDQPQSQHQPAVLSPDLHHPFLSAASRHLAGGPPGRAGDLLRRDRGDG